MKNGYIHSLWSRKINKQFMDNCTFNRICKRLEAIKTIKQQPFYESRK